MTITRRLVFRILFALATLGGLALAVCLGIAFSALHGGPNPGGYGLLATAIEALPYLAAVVSLTVIVGSIGTRVRFAVGGLALASGIVGGVAAGLVGLGSTLDRMDPLHQPPAVNSLILAVWGVGSEIVPAALVLALAAAGLALGTGIARRVSTRPTAISAATA
jgi:hypothetical protein